MKAKLLKEQMGVPAGTEMEVVETGRAWTLKAPSGAEIVVPSCDLEMVPDTEPNSEPKPNPVDPQPDEEVTGDPQPDEPRTFDDVIGSPVFAADADSDLDEDLPVPQDDCDGDSCESCQ